MTTGLVTLVVNGTPRQGLAEGRKTLVDFLREDLHLTATHIGCEHGVCGACTVLVDGVAVRSCLMLAVQAGGTTVATIEGLERDGELHPLQEAFRDSHSFQCGFCTPGFVMTALALLGEGEELSESELREYLGELVPVHGLPVDRRGGPTGNAECRGVGGRRDPRQHDRRGGRLMRFVGAKVLRVEDRRILTGRGHYVDDVQLPGMFHASFLRSPLPHGRIVSIDVEAARQAVGVIAVFTGEDMEALTSPLQGGWVLPGVKEPVF
jgi:aerobic-type carbon monoxide dehydrogenase small subunit (CoxS/CutS family)